MQPIRLHCAALVASDIRAPSAGSTTGLVSLSRPRQRLLPASSTLVHGELPPRSTAFTECFLDDLNLLMSAAGLADGEASPGHEAFAELGRPLFWNCRIRRTPASAFVDDVMVAVYETGRFR
jgi:hypothetical protein